MPIITLDKVCKKFGALTVADNISFDVPEGQALGIIGPNGAGKSTLFNLITGNLAPDSGRIELMGADATNDPATQRCIAGIGRSFQIPQPFGKMTVFENLLVAGAFGQQKPEREVRNQCAEILLETGLLAKANEQADALTLLERKRLELARALATAPKLLLLDEIAGGLTEAECQELIQTIKKIHASGTTIIWIEHVLHALISVVERLLVLDFGKIIGLGQPDEIMASKQVKQIYLGIEV
jgi:branched-chain amino acid transport system ATP-binding protein